MMPALVLHVWCNSMHETARQAFQAVARLGRRLCRRRSACGDEPAAALCYCVDALQMPLD